MKSLNSILITVLFTAFTTIDTLAQEKQGLFEMNGGTSPDLRVDITSPLFNSIKIKLDDNHHQGKEFVIKVYNNSDTNVYIQSIKLNGRPLKKNYISFADISIGGVLELYMGASGLRAGSFS